MATPRASKASQPDALFLLVDSGSSVHYFDDTIISGLENLILNLEMLETPHKISMAGNNTLLGTRTGVFQAPLSARTGGSTAFPGVIVSGMGRHLFSSKTRVQTGMCTIIDSDLPRLQQGELVLPL